jgi:hypothetical protein
MECTVAEDRWDRPRRVLWTPKARSGHVPAAPQAAHMSPSYRPQSAGQSADWRIQMLSASAERGPARDWTQRRRP